MGVFASTERQSKMELDLARPCTAREEMWYGIHDVYYDHFVKKRNTVFVSTLLCRVFLILTNKIMSFLLDS